jgi:hypothetical protein
VAAALAEITAGADPHIPAVNPQPEGTNYADELNQTPEGH